MVARKIKIDELAEKVKEKVNKENIDMAKQKVKENTKKVEKKIKENPIKSAIIAFFAGWFLSGLFRRK